MCDRLGTEKLLKADTEEQMALMEYEGYLLENPQLFRKFLYISLCVSEVQPHGYQHFLSQTHWFKC